MSHEPVMLAEATSLLAPRAEGVYLDCTLGLGGHTTALLEHGAGRVIGLDRDPAALRESRQRLQSFGDRVEFLHADYRTAASALAARGVTSIDGALADLGVSSMQLDEAERGFSFRHDGPLDMRMDPTSGAPLSERLAHVDEATLADVIWQYGEERHSRRIARAIVNARTHQPLSRTAELASIVRRAAGGGEWQRLDPATRTFQALRIWVNDELTGLGEFMQSIVGLLRAGGRLVLIAFHSLEDRIVKHTFQAIQKAGIGQVLTRKPLVADDAERERNPRSRSAKLRAVERLA